MVPKEPENAYGYAAVERALGEVFAIDARGQRGWLRGRLTNFRRLGLTPEGPGKGKTIDYTLEDVDRWMIGMELGHLRLDPAVIVELIDRTWSRPTGGLDAFAAFDRGEAALRDLITVARAGTRPDVMVTVRFDAMSRPPVIVGYTTSAGMEGFVTWLSDARWPNVAPRRASIFNLSDRVRRLDQALAAPPPPPLPSDPVAKAIVLAGRRARGEEP
jgi:hypothetical protein